MPVVGKRNLIESKEGQSVLTNESLLNVTSITDHRTNYDNCVLSDKKSEFSQVNINDIFIDVPFSVSSIFYKGEMKYEKQ